MDKAVPDAKTMNNGVRSYLWGQIVIEWKALSVATVGMIASSVANQSFTQLLRKLIDTTSSATTSTNIIKSNNGSSSNNILYGTISLIVVGGAVSSFVRTLFVSYSQECIAARIRYDVFRNIMLGYALDSSTNKTHTIVTTSTNQHPNLTTKKMSPAVLAKMLNEDVTVVSKTITDTFINMTRGLISVTVSTIQMLRIDPCLFLVSLSIIPPIGVISILLHKRKKKATLHYENAILTATQYVEERIEHIDLVRISNRQQDEVQNFTKLIKAMQSLGTKSNGFYQGTLMGFLFVATTSSLLLVLHYGQKSISANRITSGQLTTFATQSFLLGLGTSSVTKAFSEFSSGMICANRLYQYIGGYNVSTLTDMLSSTDQHQKSNLSYSSITDVNKERNESEGTIALGNNKLLSMDTIEAITLNYVSFKYNNHQKSGVNVVEDDQDVSESLQNDKMLIENVSIRLRRGAITALVGKNGSGKTTIAKILCGLYEPVSGSVVVEVIDDIANGTDEPKTIMYHSLSDLDATSRSSFVQMIPQTIGIFETISIFENVRYCQPNASEEAVYHVLERANCSDLITKMRPNGIHTIPSEYGLKLSGGEKQKIGLARALLCNPICLVLDEANNNMDNDGMQAVHEAVVLCRNNNMALLLITHSIPTLSLADEVVVLRSNSSSNAEVKNDTNLASSSVVEYDTLQNLIQKGKSNPGSSELCKLMPQLLLLP